MQNSSFKVGDVVEITTLPEDQRNMVRFLVTEYTPGIYVDLQVINGSKLTTKDWNVLKTFTTGKETDLKKVEHKVDVDERYEKLFI